MQPPPRERARIARASVAAPDARHMLLTCVAAGIRCSKRSEPRLRALARPCPTWLQCHRHMHAHPAAELSKQFARNKNGSQLSGRARVWRGRRHIFWRRCRRGCGCGRCGQPQFWHRTGEDGRARRRRQEAGCPIAGVRHGEHDGDGGESTWRALAHGVRALKDNDERRRSTRIAAFHARAPGRRRV